MHISSSFTALAAALSLSGQAHAFMVKTYDGIDCNGTSRSINVYDNSCADWPTSFRSFMPTAYGGKHQYAKAFVKSPGCTSDSDDDIWNVGWVDGGDGRFKKGQCYHLDGWYDCLSSTYNIGKG